MYISKIYLMFTAEFILILLAVCASLIIYIIKRPRSTKPSVETKTESTQASYSGYLEQEMLKNESQTQQLIEKESSQPSEAGATNSDDEKQSQLLKLREMFLKTEFSSTQHTEDDNKYWNTLYSGLKDIGEQFKQLEIRIETEQDYVVTENKSEKVFYIETQGKKVDTEINRLKDIIYQQDSTLNGLKSVLDRASEHLSDDDEELNKFKTEVARFEQQVNDSKVCMEVLELENQRLQDEIDKLEHQLEAQSEITAGDSAAISDNVNQLKQTLTNQEQQIDAMNQLMEELQLDADEADHLKSTISTITQGSKEMAGCITILEEENDNLHQKIEDLKVQIRSDAVNEDASSEELIHKIKTLEQEIIKKDVAFAKLQDEYTSMEKEYVSMYEKVHGDK